MPRTRGENIIEDEGKGLLLLERARGKLSPYRYDDYDYDLLRKAFSVPPDIEITNAVVVREAEFIPNVGSTDDRGARIKEMTDISNWKFLENRYIMEEAPLATGGMASVYVGWDIKMRRRVLIKLAQPYIERFSSSLSKNQEAIIAEAWVQAATSSVRTMPVLSVQPIPEPLSDEMVMGIIMEYMDEKEGILLKSRLKEDLTEDDRIKIAEAVAWDIGLAIDESFKKGVMHRDIKPGNILLTKDMHARLIDYGIANLTTEMIGEKNDLGTPAYMPPETAGYAQGGELKEGISSEIYRLAIVCFEILTGERYIESSTPPEIGALNEALQHGLRGRHKKSIKSLFGEERGQLLLEVFDKAMGGQPDKRYSSGRNFAGELHRALTVEIAEKTKNPLPKV